MNRIIIVCLILLSYCHIIMADMSFDSFDKRAKQGDTLSVVFFGGSLTWGANASDPNKTSYRGRMMSWLREYYPKANFVFHDAAIGGTGSNLGLFRLKRDVLSQNPDLVFLDYTINDNAEGEDTPALVTYESVLRNLLQKDIPVVQAFLAAKWHFGKGYDLNKVPRRRDHLAIAKAYNTAYGDVYPHMQETLTSGKLTLKQVWPFDSIHPDDPGYTVFFEAVKKGYLDAVQDKRVCSLIEKPVFGDTFMNAKRLPLRDMTLPKGWTTQKTFRTSLWYDGLSSRWMDDMAVYTLKKGQTPTPLVLEFTGSMVGIFGECNEKGLKATIKVDGKTMIQNKKKPDVLTFDMSTRRFTPKGNLFYWREISKTLGPGKHTLEIIPILPEGMDNGELRIESLCVAGE